MAIPILFELNQELTRLFAAGSRLSSGDPRIKKFITPLNKYGEKSPIFLKLAQLVTELLEVDTNQSAQKLIESKTFLLSVLSTQGDASPAQDNIITDINDSQNNIKLAETDRSCRTIMPVIEALTTTGSGRMEIVQQAFEKGLFNDPRLYKTAVSALEDKYAEISDYIANQVLPSMDKTVYPLLLNSYNMKGGTADGRRLSAMHKIIGENMLYLVDETAEKGNAALKAEAVKIMAYYPRYEEILLSMLDESKLVREEVMKALVKINSKRGIDKLIATYKSSKADTVLDAISCGESDYLTGELLEITRGDYEAIKKSNITVKEIERLKNDINALKNKCTDDTVEFLKKMLSEEYLIEAEEMMPKDKKQAYYYRSLEECALEALYYSAKGNDFIWQMFKDKQKGVINKVLKKSKNISTILNGFAFRIGSRILNPDEFYNTFFKSNLYKNIVKIDHYAFQNCFMQEKSPAFSRKIACYFAEMGDYSHISMACKIVQDDDNDTLNILAEFLRTSISKNSYCSGNYEILKKLGEAKHKSFKELYELYCSKYNNSSADIIYLEQFLK